MTMTAGPRLNMGDELVRRLAAAIRASQLYAPTHPLVSKSGTGLTELLTSMLGKRAVAHDRHRRRRPGGGRHAHPERGREPGRTDAAPAAGGHRTHRLRPRRRRGGAGDAGARVAAGDAASMEELIAPAAHPRRAPAGGRTRRRRGRHRHVPPPLRRRRRRWRARCGRAPRSKASPTPTPRAGMVDSLAQAVAQNRTALLALTALKNYDNYTFTHMVNVSILTMGQARGLGYRRAPAAGVRPGRPDARHRQGEDAHRDPEQAGQADRRRVRDPEAPHGGRRGDPASSTPEMPTLAPIVAFEHHLRIDGTGYPAGVVAAQLNLGTTLCGIADVYDAMRSQRVYQQALPVGPHPRGAATQRRQAVRPAPGPPVRAAGRHLSGGQPGPARHAAKSAVVSSRTRRIRIGRA